MKRKIAVAGTFCLDITPIFASEKPLPLSSVIVPGRLIAMKDVNLSPGGAVSNTGLALKKLGADVNLIAKVGEDEFGGLLTDMLKRHGVRDGSIVSAAGESTSYSVIVAAPGADRIIMHNPGTNDTFSYNDIDFNDVSDSYIFHFGYPPLMRCIYKNDGEELVKIFSEIKRRGMLSSLDMAFVDNNSDAGKADWEKIIKKVLPFTDIFVPSFEEICYMLDRTSRDRLSANGGDITEHISPERDVKPLADKLIDFGAKIVLIKCGAAGMLLKTAGMDAMSQLGEEFRDWADIEIFERSYKPKKVLSGTGAGDTSIAAFLKAISDGYSPQRCLQLAAATGSCCVEAYDALGGLKSFDELIDKIDNGWEKQYLTAEDKEI